MQQQLLLAQPMTSVKVFNSTSLFHLRASINCICMYTNNMYMYVRMYVCTYVLWYVGVYVCIYVPFYVCMYVYAHMCVYVCVFMYVCT